jgi:signal transduction histidine kinase
VTDAGVTAATGIGDRALMNTAAVPPVAGWWRRFVWWLSSPPIFVKIIGISLLAATIFGSATLFYTTNALSRHLYSQLDRRARASAAWVAYAVEEPLLVGDWLAVRERVTRALALAPDVRYVVVRNVSGKPVAHTFPSAPPPGLEALAPWSPPGECVVRVLRTPDGLVMDACYPVVKGRAGSVEIGLGDHEITRDIAALSRSQLAALALSVTVGMGLGLLLTNLLLRPVQHLVRAARRIERGHFDARSRVSSADEIGQLAVAFNQMAAALAAYRQAVQEKERLRQLLLDRVVQAQEEERKTLSRELHDQFGQSLAALKLAIGAGASAGQLPPALHDDLLARIRQLSDEAHRLAWGMRPAILDDYGLDKALARYIQELCRTSGLQIDYQYSAPPDLGRLPSRIEVTAYRVVQEALTNVLRHAQATHASVVVLRERHRITLLVEDNGKGLDLTQNTSDLSLGMAGMRERAALLGGDCDVESRPGEGATIRVHIPLTEEQ